MPGPISDSNPGPPDVQKQNVVTCVWCGHEYPTGTPRKQHDLLYAHAMKCPKHPAAQFRTKVERLRDLAFEANQKDGGVVYADDILEIIGV